LAVGPQVRHSILTQRARLGAAPEKMSRMTIGIPDFPAVLAGALVGLVLGLIGGGGSVLAVPLLVYAVGVESPHAAIGTSAVAVALSAFVNLIDHARRGHVDWPVALVFAMTGVTGAALGCKLGQHTEGDKLLLLFGVAMVAIAASMARRADGGGRRTELQSDAVPRVAGTGFMVGALAGFFGIGGGVLAVPGLVASASLPMIQAIGSSLVSVAAFSTTTATIYALAGLTDWRLVLLFVGGGIAGGVAGSRLATRLAARKRALSLIFAAVVAVVGVYVIVRGVMNLAG
jgi:uncharacterized membrane protein YfcA